MDTKCKHRQVTARDGGGYRCPCGVDFDLALVPTAAAQSPAAKVATCPECEAAPLAIVEHDDGTGTRWWTLSDRCAACAGYDPDAAAAQPPAEERSPTEGTSIISDTWNDGFAHGVEAQKRAAAAQPGERAMDALSEVINREVMQRGADAAPLAKAFRALRAAAALRKEDDQ